MAESDRIIFGKTEIKNLLGAWGKSDTDGNREILSVEITRFNNDPARSPHTWEGFYRYAENRGVRRHLVNKAAARTVALEDHPYTIVEGGAAPQAKPIFTPTAKITPPSPPIEPLKPKYTPPSPPIESSKPEYVPPSPPVEPLKPAYKPPSTPSEPPKPKYSPPSPPVETPTPQYEPPSPTPEPLESAYKPPSPSRSPETVYEKASGKGDEPLSPNKKKSLWPLILALAGFFIAAAVIIVLILSRPQAKTALVTSTPPATQTPPATESPAASSVPGAVELFTRTVAENSPVLFIANEAAWLPGEEVKLDRIRQGLAGLRKIELRLTGHTADNAMPNAQLVLSAERAAAVKAYLLKGQGIIELAIETKGKGATEPVVTGVPPGLQEANRRVVIEVVSAE